MVGLGVGVGSNSNTNPHPISDPVSLPLTLALHSRLTYHQQWSPHDTIGGRVQLGLTTRGALAILVRAFRPQVCRNKCANLVGVRVRIIL